MANMVFIELTVNAFDNVFASQTGQKQMARRGAGADSVRRPLRGIEVKDDTYAVMRVVRATGEEVQLISSSYRGGYGPSYTNFILQRVTDAREEKAQIVETFGIPYIFFFGQRPQFLEVQAMLINTLDFNWEAEFWANYDQYLRGTKCAQNGARVYLFYDDNIVEGYMLKATADKQAADKGQQVMLQFTLLLTNYTNVSMVDSSTYPVRSSSMSAAYPDLPNTDATVVNAVGIDASTVPWLIPSTPTATSAAAEQQQIESENNSLRGGLPLRSDITDNTDEWTGDQQTSTATAWDSSSQSGDYTLADQAADNAQELGADSDNPSFLQNLGLIGGGAGAFASAQMGGAAGFGGMGASMSAGASAGLSGSSAYAGAGAWADAGVGPGGSWSGSGTWSSSYSGAGGGYYTGQAVGYNQFGDLPVGGDGSIGFYSGAGYYGPGQSGTPGFGSGTSPASLGFGGYSAGAGAYAGWSPGTGSYSGSYSYGGQVTASNMPSGPGYAGSIWMPPSNYQGYGAMAGYSAGTSVQAGYAGGSASFGSSVGFGASARSSLGGYAGGAFYGGSGSYMPYAAPGYASGGYGGGTASSQYYASAYAGWDPVNGAYSGSYSSGPGGMNNGTPPTNTSGPMPGQPGGGLFTTQSCSTGGS